MVTVVVKATFSFADPENVQLIAPQPVRSEDEHLGGHPMRSLVGASDLAPQLHQVDVTLVGKARPPEPVPQYPVRLAIANQAGAILDKTLVAVGDRAPGGAPAPFSEMALDWEHAYGGIGHPDNPIGRGHDDQSKPPNVLPPDGAAKTVGFGPIPVSFPLRRKLLDPATRKAMTKRIQELPADIDWRFFQAAPPDQTVEVLHGIEWVALDGFSAEQPQMRFRLPGGMALTRVYGFERAGAPNAVPLQLDRLHIETEEKRLSMVWRGSFPVHVEEAVNDLVVAATYLSSMGAFEWPAETELQLVAHKPLTKNTLPPRVDLEGTTTIEAEDLSKSVQTLPFAGAKEELPKAVKPVDLAHHPLSGTVSLDASEVARVAMPDIPLDGTMAIEAPAASSEALPFAGGPASDSSPPSAAVSVPLPGAPWASSPRAPEVRKPASAIGTVDLEDLDEIPIVAQARAGKPLDLGASIEAMARRTEEKEQRIAREASAPSAEEKAKADAEAAEREAAAREAKERAAAEREAAEREAARAKEEAEARRREEAEKFKREQEEAKKEAERREREEAEKKAEAAKKLRGAMYGGFKRKGS